MKTIYIGFVLVAAVIFCSFFYMYSIKMNLNNIYIETGPYSNLSNEYPKQESMSTAWPTMPKNLNDKITNIIKDRSYGYKCVSGKVILATPVVWPWGSTLKLLTRDICAKGSESNGIKFDCILNFDAGCK